MSSNYWIKLYHETLDDPKMGRLTDRQYRRVVELFLLAGDYDNGGLLPPIEDIEFRLRFPNGLKEDLGVLVNCKIISIDEQKRYYITRWEDRQGPMSNQERQSRYREAKRKSSYYGNTGVTNCNTDKDKEVDVEKIKNRVDEDVASDNDLQYLETLSDTFRELTHIQLEPKEFVVFMKVGATKHDMRQAVRELAGKDMNIPTSPEGMWKPVINVINKRKAKDDQVDQEDYRRYIKGKYGEIGSY